MRKNTKIDLICQSCLLFIVVFGLLQFFIGMIVAEMYPLTPEKEICKTINKPIFGALVFITLFVFVVKYLRKHHPRVLKGSLLIGLPTLIVAITFIWVCIDMAGWVDRNYIIPKQVEDIYFSIDDVYCGAPNKDSTIIKIWHSGYARRSGLVEVRTTMFVYWSTGRLVPALPNASGGFESNSFSVTVPLKIEFFLEGSSFVLTNLDTEEKFLIGEDRKPVIIDKKGVRFLENDEIRCSFMNERIPVTFSFIEFYSLVQELKSQVYYEIKRKPGSSDPNRRHEEYEEYVARAHAPLWKDFNVFFASCMRADYEEWLRRRTKN